ncbi:acyl-CoA thioesterase II [Carbonactinospora thermoautotrophica]|uniref:acyl-CoA thioesterase n=1 Tax=Carbonactinospora thermoautotrophica TaxID=1469144 RepID=UPI002270CF1E|nr:acyl-CoA thioesterase II [Carbonactinospora thermoautotrophica]MCX9192403.1 acyl-CoA thioesterase II [Carbonactinospora thermoautotrophica]
MEPVAELLDLLDLTPIATDEFIGRNPERSLPFVFGGQVAAQSLAAAGRTVDSDRSVHSLHAYFLRAGDPTRPIRYRVERTRDGRSFSARRVVASQEGGVIFTLAASFHIAEDGLDHQIAMPAVPPPDTLPRLETWLAPHTERLPSWWRGPMAVDLRYVDEPPHVLTRERDWQPRQALWMRADGELPDDPLVHVCVLTFASDLTLLDPVLLAHGISWYTGRVRAASLDHALWFHRPLRADRWLLYAQESPTASGARGLARGSVFDAEGTLVATVMQEGLIRLLD